MEYFIRITKSTKTYYSTCDTAYVGKFCHFCRQKFVLSKQKKNFKARAVASLTIPDGQKFHFPLFPQISINISYFSSIFSHFLPHVGSPGGRVAHLGRPWLYATLLLLYNPVMF